jgi:hypothetical protein
VQGIEVEASMGIEQRDYILQQYREMDEEQLAHIAGMDLTDVAAEALKQVLAEKGIPADRLMAASTSRAKQHKLGGLNKGLRRVHQGLQYFYLALLVVGVSIALIEGTMSIAGTVGSVVPLILILIHHSISVGVDKGEEWAKSASIFFGVIFLLGIPIGTVLGIFMLSQTGKRWESNAVSA